MSNGATRRLFSIPAACVGSAIMLWSGVALADGWPTSIQGTWNVVANQTAGQLIISQAGAGVCKRITGTIFGSQVQGSYCPGAGTLTFHRYLNANKTASQFYRANLSQQQVNRPLRMAGSFAVRSDLDSPGEYSFYGVK
jgi:hypothetical protein